MPSNIKINDVKSLRFRCKYDEYYDFMLYRGECYGDGIFGNCLSADITADELPIGPVKRDEPKDGEKSSYTGGEVYSKVTWSDAINVDTTMRDIGLTGIDNGFITYRKDNISNRDFLKIFTGTTYTIPDESKMFYMSPVSGNTQMYTYPMEVVETPEEGKFFAMKGGLLQGFFKLHEMDYQTLPYFIEDEWNMSFRIRPRKYEVEGNTLNKLHPDNEGIFFYMGTRSENKFWELYNNAEDKAEFLLPGYGDDSYVEGWDLQNHITEYTDYLEREIKGEDNIDYSTLIDGYSIDPEYWEKDIDLAEIEVLTSLGYALDKWGYYEIQTDNKFVFFNRTCTGFTVNNWDLEENDYTYNACKNTITPTDHEAPLIGLTGITSNCKENKFITYNRTCTGKTVHHVHRGCYHNGSGKGKSGSSYGDDYYMDEYEPYDIYKDIRDNSFALRVNPKTGAIGYKFGILDCDEPLHHYSVKEEYSKPGMIPYDQWTDIHVKFKILNPTYRDCIKYIDGVKTVVKVPTHIGERKMRIYIYVNGYLVFISQELKEFRFRALNDVYQKQEGIPFSISLGGGTQGLLETISKDYYHISEYCLPIESNFGGTFIGDIKYFRFYDCFMDLPTIRRKRLFIE